MTPSMCLFFLFPIISGHLPLAAGQGNFWGQYCGDTGNYTQNSDYKRNLDDTLYSLAGTNNGFGYCNSTSGLANAASLCRGDIDPETCRRCVDDATRRLRQVCPNQIEATGWYDACFLRYSNRDMKTGNGISAYAVNVNSISNSSFDQWNQTLENLLGVLRHEASGGGEHRKYGSGNVTGPEPLTIYGIMQCTPDLSESECDQCLIRAAGDGRPFVGRLGLGIYKPSCVIRYEIYKFFNETWYPASAPSTN